MVTTPPFDFDRYLASFRPDPLVDADPKARAEALLQRRAGPVDVALHAEIPEWYGGMWSTDGRLVINIKSPSRAIDPSTMDRVQAIAERFGVSQDIEVHPVEHSMREVDAANKWFGQASSKLHEASGDGLSGSLNSFDVVVEVNAGGELTEGQLRLIAELKARFGSLVRITDDPPITATAL